MQRTNSFIKVMTVAVFIALLIYGVYTAYDAFTNVFRTSGVFTQTVEDSCAVSGNVVRDEYIVEGDGNAYLLASDGDTVCASQKLAAVYKDSSYVALEDELKALTVKQREIQEAITGLGEKRDLTDDILTLSYDLSRKDLDAAGKTALELQAFLFESYSSMTEDQLKNELSSVASRMKALNTSLSAGAAYIYAKSPGTFSSELDGYESVTPSSLSALTVSGYDNLFSSPAKVSSTAICKMINGIYWYYAAKISSDQAQKLTVGKSCNILFQSIFSAPISMKVASISDAEDGQCVIVLSTSKYMPQVCSTRKLDGKIIFSSYSGIRVAKDAIYTDDDGTNYLYILRIIQAKRINITILSEMDGYYIIADDGSIPANAEIIVKANDLYDGKVVQ